MEQPGPEPVCTWDHRYPFVDSDQQSLGEGVTYTGDLLGTPVLILFFFFFPRYSFFTHNLFCFTLSPYLHENLGVGDRPAADT